MKIQFIILAFLISIFAACASFSPASGTQQIQKKCHNVIGMPDGYVCEQP